MLALAAAVLALPAPLDAEARGYCGTARGYEVYASGIACAKARYYVRREACPRRWRGSHIVQEFGFEVIGYRCRRAGRQLSAFG